ncbi:MAG: response regulator [Dethiobacteria bacterium]|jgi:CheY-like chemotaxis protein
MKSILVIDDEPALTMIFEEFLTDLGFKVKTASNGKEALNILENEPPPNLVLVDLKMPGISGKMVIENMRQNNTLAKIPVIIITGSVKNKIDFPPDGSYQAVIYKPFRLEEVLETIEKHI